MALKQKSQRISHVINDKKKYIASLIINDDKRRDFLNLCESLIHKLDCQDLLPQIEYSFELIQKILINFCPNLYIVSNDILDYIYTCLDEPICQLNCTTFLSIFSLGLSNLSHIFTSFEDLSTEEKAFDLIVVISKKLRKAFVSITAFEKYVHSKIELAQLYNHISDSFKTINSILNTFTKTVKTLRTIRDHSQFVEFIQSIQPFTVLGSAFIAHNADVSNNNKEEIDHNKRSFLRDNNEHLIKTRHTSLLCMQSSMKLSRNCLFGCWDEILNFHGYKTIQSPDPVLIAIMKNDTSPKVKVAAMICVQILIDYSLLHSWPGRLEYESDNLFNSNYGAFTPFSLNIAQKVRDILDSFFLMVRDFFLRLGNLHNSGIILNKSIKLSATDSIICPSNLVSTTLRTLSSLVSSIPFEKMRNGLVFNVLRISSPFILKALFENFSSSNYIYLIPPETENTLKYNKRATINLINRIASIPFDFSIFHAAVLLCLSILNLLPIMDEIVDCLNQNPLDLALFINAENELSTYQASSFKEVLILFTNDRSCDKQSIASTNSREVPTLNTSLSITYRITSFSQLLSSCCIYEFKKFEQVNSTKSEGSKNIPSLLSDLLAIFHRITKNYPSCLFRLPRNFDYRINIAVDTREHINRHWNLISLKFCQLLDSHSSFIVSKTIRVFTDLMRSVHNFETKSISDKIDISSLKHSLSFVYFTLDFDSEIKMILHKHIHKHIVTPIEINKTSYNLTGDSLICFSECNSQIWPAFHEELADKVLFLSEETSCRSLQSAALRALVPVILHLIQANDLEKLIRAINACVKIILENEWVDTCLISLSTLTSTLITLKELRNSSSENYPKETDIDSMDYIWWSLLFSICSNPHKKSFWTTEKLKSHITHLLGEILSILDFSKSHFIFKLRNKQDNQSEMKSIPTMIPVLWAIKMLISALQDTYNPKLQWNAAYAAYNLYLNFPLNLDPRYYRIHYILIFELFKILSNSNVIKVCIAIVEALNQVQWAFSNESEIIYCWKACFISIKRLFSSRGFFLSRNDTVKQDSTQIGKNTPPKHIDPSLFLQYKKNLKESLENLILKLMNYPLPNLETFLERILNHEITIYDTKNTNRGFNIDKEMEEFLQELVTEGPLPCTSPQIFLKMLHCTIGENKDEVTTHFEESTSTKLNHYFSILDRELPRITRN